MCFSDIKHNVSLCWLSTSLAIWVTHKGCKYTTLSQLWVVVPPQSLRGATVWAAVVYKLPLSIAISRLDNRMAGRRRSNVLWNAKLYAMYGLVDEYYMSHIVTVNDRLADGAYRSPDTRRQNKHSPLVSTHLHLIKLPTNRRALLYPSVTGREPLIFSQVEQHPASFIYWSMFGK